MLRELVVRALKSGLEILVWIDQGVGLVISVPFYLALGYPKPNARDTISSVVGYYAIERKRWALVAEWIIDRLFYIPNGFKLGHCRDHIEWNEVSGLDLGRQRVEAPKSTETDDSNK